MLTGGCTQTGTPRAESGSRPPDTSASAGSAAVADLVPAFESASATVHATVGLAVAPVGSGEPVTAGSWQSGPAWSTIKVPLALAATERPPDGDAARIDAAAALGASDNAAADRLWQSLGPPDVAANETQEVLAEHGDTATRVESRVVREGFSAFGQTQWSLDAQARFAAALACDPSASEVLGTMTALAPGQRWGLAALPGVAAKGGWGPGEDGGYLARQFGIVPAEEGAVAVALAAEAASFDDATAALTTLASALGGAAASAPLGGSC
ncbi:hypothetical protein HCA44_15205 [Rhodococcus sp. HNM0569]|nr:hypothetical protein [Rhodococcus sp. HNM0569]